MVEARLANLIQDMATLLKLYEKELTAYQQAYGMIEHEAQKAGVTMGIRQALESLASNPTNAKEVDGIYAPIEQLAHSMTQENLDRATFAIHQGKRQRGVVRVNLPHPSMRVNLPQTDPKGPIQ